MAEIKLIGITCKNCIYFIDEYGKHIKGCYLHPYRMTLPNDLVCKRFLKIDLDKG